MPKKPRRKKNGASMSWKGVIAKSILARLRSLKHHQNNLKITFN